MVAQFVALFAAGEAMCDAVHGSRLAGGQGHTHAQSAAAVDVLLCLLDRAIGQRVRAHDIALGVTNIIRNFRRFAGRGHFFRDAVAQGIVDKLQVGLLRTSVARDGADLAVYAPEDSWYILDSVVGGVGPLLRDAS